MRQLLLVLLFSSLASTSFAASFDCSKASSDQEKMICADNNLSELDSRLTAIYKAAVKASTISDVMAKDQRDWLRDVRNKCTSPASLTQAYEKRISDLTRQPEVTAVTEQKAADPKPTAPETALSGCAVSEKDLVGAWKNMSNGLFEEMSLSKKGTEHLFESWLHQRPEILDGRWKLENCNLYIENPSNSQLDVVYGSIRIKGDLLYMREAGEQDEAVYKRIR